MEGNPAQFETIGSRLGFRVAADEPEKIVLVWQGARFPAFLCLGIAVALLFISVPIVEALRQRGFEGPAASLWYFPLMNLILLEIAAYLLSVKRTIVFDRRERRMMLRKRSLLRTAIFSAAFDEIDALRLGTDQVYSGFALGGSTAAETYAVASLRLIVQGGETVLLDRGGMKKLESLGARLGAFVEKPLDKIEIDGERRYAGLR
jgi:hypothetical protein